MKATSSKKSIKYPSADGGQMPPQACWRLTLCRNHGRHNHQRCITAATNQRQMVVNDQKPVVI
jgi:hypothetical protein